MVFPIGDDQIERGHTPIFSYSFIAINVAIFFWQFSMGEAGDAFINNWGAIPNNISAGLNYETLITSIFMHGGWMHLLGNMMFLWIFADNIEATIGSGRFLLFYLLGGLAAGLAQIIIDPSSEIPCVGASGAIAAVMGAYIVMFPKSRVKMLFLLFFNVFYIPAWVFLGFWFAQQLTSGFGIFDVTGEAGGNVAWWAHIGGFVFGLAAGFLFRLSYLGNNAEEEQVV
jgi:membrane associated rhomboid family serine protease